jgi:adenylylsulfate reductase subunit A
MMTVDGLFAAGDAAGGTAHAFSSGSFTEGRLCAKAAVKYIQDQKAVGITVTDNQIEKLKEDFFC